MPTDAGDPSFRWTRSAVGRGWSHPLKRQDFDTVLAAYPVDALESVWLATHDFISPASYFPASRIPRPADIDPDDFLLLGSCWWQGVGDDYAPSFSAAIHIYPVPTDERAIVRPLLVAEALPALLKWIGGIESGPETGRTERRRIAIYRQEDRVRQAGD